ncbi:MAG: NUDIX hydrolase [Gemmatimonadota bacterium]|nr:MAG: NUDIX hydrolase [Gemmatimonadota bacterium]
MPNKRARTERSAGGVVTRRMEGAVHFLLIRDPYGKLGLPKGHVENGETAEAAALREVGEETGLTGVEIGPSLGTTDWYFRFEGRLIHKYCQYFLMGSRFGDPEPERSEGITECRWLPVDEAIAEVAYDNAREVMRVAQQLIDSGTADGLLEESDAKREGSG